MAARDPRDPRTNSAPVGEQLDRVAAGFDVTITTLTAALGEVIRTQQEGNALLAALTSSVAGEEAVGGGIGGVRPAPSSNLMGRQAMVSQLQSSGGRRTYAPYSAGLSYAVSPDGGSLANQTRTGIRSGVANWLTGRASHLSDQYDLHQGEYLNPFTGDVRGPMQGFFMDDQGRYRHNDGSFAKKADAVGTIMSGDERSGVASRLATAQVASRMGQAWAENGSISRAVVAGLPQGAMKAVGAAGAVVAVGKQGWEWAQGQYEANRKFQEAYGGGNLDQVGERFAQWGNRLRGYTSLLGADNYDKLFSGAMSMGLRGGDRERYINTGADIMGTGASSEQTTKLMNMSVEAGLGLAGLASAIRDVNNAARDAGVNAARARDIFIKNYEASSEIMFGSQNAKGFANSMTVGQLAQARPYQGINTMGAIDNTSVSYLRAGQLGMTMSELELAQKESPTGTMLNVEQMLLDSLDKFPNPEGKGTSFRQAVNEFMAELEARGEVYEPKYHQVELGEYVTSKGWPSYTLKLFLARYGIQVEDSLAAGYIANLYTRFSPGNLAAKSEQFHAKDLAPKTGQTKDVADTNYMGTTSLTGGGLPGYNVDINSPLRNSALAPLMEAYIGGLSKGKDGSVTRLPVVESFITDSAQYGVSESTKVMVMTKDGAKVVSFKEALRDFPDQIQAGTARFVGGLDDEYVGKTTGDITGYKPDDSFKVNSRTKSIDYGQTDEDFQAQQEADQEKKSKDEGGSSTNTKVSISLSPEAQRLLRVVDQQTYSSSSAPSADVG